MKILAIFTLITMLSVAVNGQGDRVLGASCSDSIQCSSGYCYDGKCIEWGTIQGEVGRTNPCWLVRCAGGPCVIQQGRCPNPPCPGKPDCRPPA